MGKYHIFFVTIIVILLTSISAGVFKLIYSRGSLIYAYLINLFWAAWWLVMGYCCILCFSLQARPEKVRERVRQTYEGLEISVVDMLACGIELEELIAKYYMHLAEKYPEHRNKLYRIARDSFRHAKIYRRILNSAKESIHIKMKKRCSGISAYIERLRDLENMLKDEIEHDRIIRELKKSS